MNDSAQNDHREQPALDADRKRRIRRNVVLLSLTALAFYVGYIVMSIK